MKPRRVASEAWRDGGRVLIRLRAYVESARSSLFAIPVIWIVAAIGLSQLITWIDLRTQDNDELPGFLDTTVESARALLGAISSGTISAASVVFSLTLVAIQMSSSVYTSRVLRSFLRDRFQQNMIGVLLATFTYSLLVLREVRGPLDAEGSAYIPRLSVFLAVLFAIAAVFALLASISHTSQSLRASSVTRQLVEEMVELIDDAYPEPSVWRDDDADEHEGDERPEPSSATDAMMADATSTPSRPQRRQPTDLGAVLTADRRGWVQQVSLEAIRDSIDDGSTVRLDVSAGSYVGAGSPLLVLWPPPSADELPSLLDDLRGAFAIGEQRSMQQDLAFGFTMLEDIANKALSPGVNDPNTASAVIEQLGEVVLAVLERRPHSATMTLDGCEFIRSRAATYDDIVVAAFNQIRHYAIGQPSVQLVLVRTLIDIGDELIRRRRDTPESLEALGSMLGFIEADLAPEGTDPAAGRTGELIAASSWYDSCVSAAVPPG